MKHLCYLLYCNGLFLLKLLPGRCVVFSSNQCEDEQQFILCPLEAAVAQLITLDLNCVSTSDRIFVVL